MKINDDIDWTINAVCTADNLDPEELVLSGMGELVPRKELMREDIEYLFSIMDCYFMVRGEA